MKKLYERKNIGIPVTILIIIAYLIGYSLTRSLSGTLLTAVLFAGAIFSLQFDDRVKNAVKHSYIFATFVQLVYFAFEIFSKFITMVFGGRITNINSIQDIFYDIGFFQRTFNILYTYGLHLVEIAVIVVFALFIIMTLLKKDVNIGLVENILGDAPAKPKNKPSTYQNQSGQGQQNFNRPPVPPVGPQGQPPVAPPQAPVNAQTPLAPHQTPVNVQTPVETAQAPVNQQSPLAHKAPGCHNCGHVNQSEAKFCSSCGSKL